MADCSQSAFMNLLKSIGGDKKMTEPVILTAVGLQLALDRALALAIVGSAILSNTVGKGIVNSASTAFSIVATRMKRALKTIA